MVFVSQIFSIWKRFPYINILIKIHQKICFNDIFKSSQLIYNWTFLKHFLRTWYCNHYIKKIKKISHSREACFIYVESPNKSSSVCSYTQKAIPWTSLFPQCHLFNALLIQNGKNFLEVCARYKMLNTHLFL